MCVWKHILVCLVTADVCVPAQCCPASGRQSKCFSELCRLRELIWGFQSNEGGLLWWLSGQESACQCRRHEFDPRSRKIPRAAEQLTPRVSTVERTHTLEAEATAVRSPSTAATEKPRGNEDPEQPKSKQTGKGEE